MTNSNMGGNVMGAAMGGNALVVNSVNKQSVMGAVHHPQHHNISQVIIFERWIADVSRVARF